MTNKEILQADFLDILFEHRNKLYGAYALRKTYTQRLGKSLGVALSIMLALISISVIKKEENSGALKADVGSVILREVTLNDEKIKDPEKPKLQPQPQKSTVDFNKIVVVPDEKADKVLPDLARISVSLIGSEDIEGTQDDGAANPVSESNGNGEEPIKEYEVQRQPDLPSYPPKFPGDWPGFLQRYLQSPESLEPGQRVEVFVRFWVDVDGSVSRPEVIKSGGAQFDKEVLRVLKKMPKWEPAMQAGHHVAVAYTQPIIFMGVEE